MRTLQLSVLLCAAIAARCAPLDTHTSDASAGVGPTTSAAEPTEDQIRLKLASPPAETVGELQKLASAIAQRQTDSQVASEDEAKPNEVFDGELQADLSDDDISSRFWYWHKKQKKKPSHHQVVHGAEALGHTPHEDILDASHAHDHAEENPGFIKPIVDKIKKPIVDILNKPADIVSHLLNKPHDVLHNKPSIDDIKKPLEAIIQKPAEIVGDILNKPHGSIHDIPIIDDHVDKPDHINHHGDEGLLHDKPGLIDHITKPIEAFINKPDLGHDKPGIIDNIKKPIEDLLHKPAEIASQFPNKPHSVITEGSHQHFPSKPSIIDHIKKPIDAVFHKPVSSIKPEHFDSIIHFPADEDHGTHKPTIVDNLKPHAFNKPIIDEPYELFGALADFFPSEYSLGEIHKFKPSIGLLNLQSWVDNSNHKPHTVGNIKPVFEEQNSYWRPIWDVPYYAPQRPHRNSWIKPWQGLPHSANYGIPSGSYVRGLETDSSENAYAQAYPYGGGQDFIFI